MEWSIDIKQGSVDITRTWPGKGLFYCSDRLIDRKDCDKKSLSPQKAKLFK